MTVKEFYEQEKNKYPESIRMVIASNEEAEDCDFADEIVELYGHRKLIEGHPLKLATGEIVLVAEIEEEQNE